jgi:hypothetical protein
MCILHLLQPRSGDMGKPGTEVPGKIMKENKQVPFRDGTLNPFPIQTHYTIY